MAGESVTYGTLLARTREMLMDEGHGSANAKRWKDEELYRFLFDGVTAMEKLRPAIRYQGMRLAERTFPSVASAESAPVLVDRHYHEGIVHYACYRALQMDENDATPAYRSNMHHKRFEEIAMR